jgi:DNA-binding NarL/FixJ family response regulator
MRMHIDSITVQPERLTQRQSTIVTLISDGHSAKDTARLLGISYRTVERHLDKAKQATNTQNTTALVAKAIRQGWVA